VEWMPREIEPQRFSLGLQPLALRPFPYDGKLVLERLARLVAEQRRLSALERARRMLGEPHRVRNRQHQARAIRAEPVERAGAREGFEHATVELLRVDAAAKIEQILVRPVRLAFRDDRLSGTLADALDRAEPVADAPHAVRREDVRGAVHVRRLDLDPELRAILAQH